jgi:hypothetical protein
VRPDLGFFQAAQDPPFSRRRSALRTRLARYRIGFYRYIVGPAVPIWRRESLSGRPGRRSARTAHFAAQP